jgi:hypothetical protein
LIATTAYIYTTRGIIAIQATPQTFQRAGIQIADDVGRSVAGTERQAMTAIELAATADQSIQLARAKDPTLETT